MSPPPRVHYPWPEAPADGALRTVAPGIEWLRLPLPIALDHLNVYLLADDEGLVVFDTGFNTPALVEHWAQLLAARELGPRPRVLCSHYHPDHFGLVGHLCERYGFELMMTQTEWLIAALLRQSPPAANAEAQLAFFSRHGMDAAALERHAGRGGQFRQSISGAPLHYRQLRDGQLLDIGGRQWQLITGAGHTPEQVCLYCPADALLLCADHVLPRISPNTSVFYYNPGTNPLEEYLRSFERFAHIPDQVLCLPCHDVPFTGLQARLQQLRDHHEERLALLLDHCRAAPRSAHSLIAPMFDRALDPHQEMFALGEIVAHLHLLESRGQLHPHWDRGVQRFGVEHAAGH